MTIRIVSGSRNPEIENAEKFKAALLNSAPELDHPDIRAELLCNLHLPKRELDLVLLYHDSRPEELQLKNSDGYPIHSFVLIVEVKHHSSDLIRFQGPSVEVRYGQKWHDATSQCVDQAFELKRYQSNPYQGQRRRYETFVQRAIWLARAREGDFNGTPSESSVPVHFSDVCWHKLVDGFVVRKDKKIRTLVDDSTHRNRNYHSLSTLLGLLTHEVLPTRLDLRRVNALTQTRFDAEKTAYIQNLGKGLLILRGRGGTGKTFALVQIALHLARQGKSTVLLTYNHGLIADINRALRFISDKNPDLYPIPEIETRYSFIQSIFTRSFGYTAEKVVRKHIDDISEREDFRLRALSKPNEFLDAKIPGECRSTDRYPCPICDGSFERKFRNISKKNEPKTWRDISLATTIPTGHFDFVLVDEGQDWSEEQRDLIFKLFGPGHVVAADGVDQFVGSDRCEWDRGDIKINRKHPLRASKRTKAATCQTIAEVARELGLSDWDLTPDPDAHGGRFTVIVEPDVGRGVERGLAAIDADQQDQRTLRSVDSLVCLPSSKMARGKNFAAMFDKEIERSARDSWRGFDENDRRVYPVRDSQLRAIQYHSCRGMEGWTTLCLGLDMFFDYQLNNPRIDVGKIEEQLRNREGFLFSEELLQRAIATERRNFALNWLMIPLTRSIDHLVVHISDDNSALGQVLQIVSNKSPGSIEWILAE